MVLTVATLLFYSLSLASGAKDVQFTCEKAFSLFSESRLWLLRYKSAADREASVEMASYRCIVSEGFVAHSQAKDVA